MEILCLIFGPDFFGVPLPATCGSHGFFQGIHRGLEEGTGQKVVGVSVCWDFQDYEDELLAPWMGDGGWGGWVGMGMGDTLW